MQICVLGATGLVGHELLTLINRAWPGADLALFASRDQTMVHDGEEYEVRAATRLEQPDAPKGDLAFVALDDVYSARYCPRLVELGYKVIDKSNTYRLQQGIPLAVAGVNHGRVTHDTSLVANPNCTTIPFTLAVKPLAEAFGLRGATVSTYQAISGAGVKPLDAFLEASASGYAAKDRLGAGFDAGAYAANVVPHNGKTDDSGFSSEERKLVNESRKILEMPEFAVCAQSCRVPIAVGHYENAWVEFEREATAEGIDAAWEGAPFLHRVPGAAGDGLSALACLEHRDLALVGRVRPDPRDASGRTWCMTVVSDNIRLGAATNAVRVASRWFPTQDPALGV